MKNNIAITKAFKSQQYAEAEALINPKQHMNGKVAFSKGFDKGWDAAMDYFAANTLYAAELKAPSSALLLDDNLKYYLQHCKDGKREIARNLKVSNRVLREIYRMFEIPYSSVEVETTVEEKSDQDEV